MVRPSRYISAVGSAAALAATLACVPAAGAAALSPLPASAYGVSAVCAASAPGRAGCLAMKLVPHTAEARARRHPLGVARAPVVAAPSPTVGSFGMRPQDLHSAYVLPTTAPTAQTVAIVDAYNDPNAESDLKKYSEEFSLPTCTAAGGCFRQLDQEGLPSPLPFPESASTLEAAGGGDAGEVAEAEEATGWDLEISLDVETVHAICQSCHILLVEADSPSYADLETAERTAERLGADEVSNSWGGPELGESPSQESSSAFNDPGIVVTASAGDRGYLGWDAPNAEERGYAEFPASSPHVVAVGGTRLTLGAGSAWADETVWNGDGAGGGGCSVEFSAPAWQQSLANWSAVGCGGHRAVADVSADADPYTGLAVHDTSGACEYAYEEGGIEHVLHWCTIGGTSLASPLIASVFALAGGAGGVSYPAKTLYQNEESAPTALHDVVNGSNGECLEPFNGEGLSGCTIGEEATASCAGKSICRAGAGYDGPSGVGTPDGVAAFSPASSGGSEAGASGEGSSSGGGSAGGGSSGGGSSGGGSSGGGSSGGGSSGGGSSGGGSAGGGSSGSGSSVPGGGSPAGAGAPATTSTALQISHLALTLKALIALNASRPRTGQVSFSFTLDRPGRVAVVLALRAHGHARSPWRALPGSLALSAAAGRNTRHLSGHRILAAGLYRLTATPAGGSARAIEFQIG